MLLHGQTSHTVSLAAADRGHHPRHRHPNYSCSVRQQICGPCQLPAPALDAWSCCMRGLPLHPHQCRLLGLVLTVGGVSTMMVVVVL